MDGAEVFLAIVNLYSGPIITTKMQLFRHPIYIKMNIGPKLCLSLSDIYESALLFIFAYFFVLT